MKIYIIAAVLFLATLSLADEYIVKTSEDLQQYRKECVAELKVPETNIEQYKKLDFPNDETTQCYLKCVFSKFGLFNPTTGFNVENVHKQLVGKTDAVIEHDNDLHVKIQACVDNNEQGSNVCEWAYRGGTCIIKQNLPIVQQQTAATTATATAAETTAGTTTTTTAGATTS